MSMLARRWPWEEVARGIEQHRGGSCTEVGEIDAQQSACIVEGKSMIHQILCLDFVDTT